MSGGVLAVRQDSLGDVLLAGPALRAMSRAPGPLTLLCGRRGAAAAHLLPGVDETLVWTAPWIDPEPGAVSREDCRRLISSIEARAPREAVIFTSFHQSPLPTALLLRLAGVPRIAAIGIDYPGSLLDVRHRVPDDVHEVERALSLAGAAGHTLAPADEGGLAVRLEAEPPPLPDEPFFVVHPGASVPARAWEPERWAELAALLAGRGHRVVVTGSLEELALTRFVAAGAPGAINLGGVCDLGDLAAVLARAGAVAVANTGPAHLAAAVGTPVVSLFAPTVPAVRWRPWRVPHELLQREVPCAGCRAHECPVVGHPCLAAVAPVEAAEGLRTAAAASTWPAPPKGRSREGPALARPRLLDHLAAAGPAHVSVAGAARPRRRRSRPGRNLGLAAVGDRALARAAG
jgi:ADP-heptose:LPS heptosyltransferase